MSRRPEDAVARLQLAARLGKPVMFPGTREPRPREASRDGVPAVGVLGPHAAPAAEDDLGRLQVELETGGAPWERRIGRPATIGEGLRRSIAGFFGGWRR